MGGFGSGRRPGKRATDGALQINAYRLRRDGLLTPGVGFLLTWPGPAPILHAVAGEDHLLIRHLGPGPDPLADPPSLEYPIPISWVRLHFGGAMPFFHCPACGRRMAILYLGGERFACRRCHGLAYPSQRETASDRALRRANAIRRKLGWPEGIASPKGPKPSRMRRDTFERLVAEHDSLAKQAIAGMVERLGRIAGRLR